MINKGNVLQYKINSSNLTKNQRYSKIAQGQWTNRTKTFASQSTRGYTNPNTQSLMRVGGSNVTTTGEATDLPVTCLNNIRPINRVLPVNVSNNNNNQVLPPPPPPPEGRVKRPVAEFRNRVPRFDLRACGKKCPWDETEKRCYYWSKAAASKAPLHQKD